MDTIVRVQKTKDVDGICALFNGHYTVVATEDYSIDSHETRLIYFGFRIALPNGYFIRVDSESFGGSDFKVESRDHLCTDRDEFFVILTNKRDSKIKIKKGSLIANFVIASETAMEFKYVSEVEFNKLDRYNRPSFNYCGSKNNNWGVFLINLFKAKRNKFE